MGARVFNFTILRSPAPRLNRLVQPSTVESGTDIESSYQGLINLVKAHPELMSPEAPDPEMFKVKRITEMKKKSKVAYGTAHGDLDSWDEKYGELNKELFRACMASMQALEARGGTKALL